MRRARLLLLPMLVLGARKDRTGALLALPPIVLLAISLLSVELLTWFHIRTSIFPFGLQIAVRSVALVLHRRTSSAGWRHARRQCGHLPPYRNGIAIDLPGSLPLGILPDADYEVHTIQLDPTDQLTFLTDGVPEARNAAGELLGFGQGAQLSSLRPEAIAQAAITYGQDDDITIVNVRLCAPAHIAESAPVFEVSPIWKLLRFRRA